MCLFKKKKKPESIINSRFIKGQNVKFKYRGDVCPGIIDDVFLDIEGNVRYDVQIGGECPAVIRNVKEDEIFS